MIENLEPLGDFLAKRLDPLASYNDMDIEQLKSQQKKYLIEYITLLRQQVFGLKAKLHNLEKDKEKNE